MALKDKLAAARFNFKDLTFCLDGTLNARRDALMQDLATEIAKQEKGKDGDSRIGSSNLTTIKAKIEALEESMRDKSITIRITAVNNGLWQKWIIQHPPRKGNTTDQALGYNVETFFFDAMVLSSLYVDDPGTEENDWEDAVLTTIESSEWAQINEAWTAGDWDRVHITLLTLNQREGARGVDFLKRDSGATQNSGATSDSPENSE